MLRAAGARVGVVEPGCCGRPLLSQGLVGPARARARRALGRLGPHALAGRPIVVLEPSCWSMLVDDSVPHLPARRPAGPLGRGRRGGLRARRARRRPCGHARRRRRRRGPRPLPRPRPSARAARASRRSRRCRASPCGPAGRAAGRAAGAASQRSPHHRAAGLHPAERLAATSAASLVALVLLLVAAAPATAARPGLQHPGRPAPDRRGHRAGDARSRRARGRGAARRPRRT